jgi:Bacteriophage T4-like portal protein (Gp20)
MADNWIDRGFGLFGFTIKRKEDKKKEEEQQVSFALPPNDDGAVTVNTGAGFYGSYVDFDGTARNEVELITKYREMAMQPELESAIDDIANEAIVNDDSGNSVEINVDELSQPNSIKNKIRAEFEETLKLLNFGNMGHEIFRRWYIDGRLFYHVIIDENAPREGIKELRYIDPRRIRKIRQIEKTKDPKTGMDIIKSVQEYYLYNERGIIGAHSNVGVRIAPDSIININSGLMDSRRAMVLSYLHKAIKPLNQLRMVEDAMVIYRLSRAPERRVFYIDVGNMPTIKAEQYLRDIMVKYRNKLVYDSSTGEIRDDRKHMAMLEDFWLPRREGSRGTEISTLPGGSNLSDIEDVKYFEKKLYKALGVPISRLEAQEGFSLGRSTEITRDELKFTRFIDRLRSKFSTLFDEILRIQLVMKNVCTEEDWKMLKEDIWYDFLKDNNFDELKEAELNRERIGLLTLVDPFVDRYYSRMWVRKNILKQSDEEIEQMDKEIAEDPSIPAGPTDPAGNPLPVDPATGHPYDPHTGIPYGVDATGNPIPGAVAPPSMTPPPPEEDPKAVAAKKKEEAKAKNSGGSSGKLNINVNVKSKK